MNSDTKTFTFSEIVKITSNFQTMIGKGGFGEVYLGTLKDGTKVAVKKLLSSSDRKAFITEVKLLADVHHPNLVSLVGYCDEDGKEAFILEYMSNGNLKQHLSEKSKRVFLWIRRLHIALDVACGLEYLHGQKLPIVHRDLKPDNILLDKYMQAKVADFGLSRVFETDSATHISTRRVGGTFGYIDPDSCNMGQICKGSDVYSFGIILLELVTGKPAIITQGPDDERTNISKWIDLKSRDIKKIVDPRLNGEFNIRVAQEVKEIALSCVKPIKERPDISQILTKLKECLAKEVCSRVLGDTSRSNFLSRLGKNIRPRRQEAIMKPMGDQQPLNLRNFRIFTGAEVATITSEFKKAIEERISYAVYLGTLNDGAQVAVKIFSPSSFNKKYCPFQTEVENIRHLCHRNVVSAVGYCDENNIKALIFEYMANGNLRQHLSGESRRILCWNERLQIAIDIAYGLKYLQNRCNVPRNLTSAIIFLNEDMRGKVDGFRLPKFLDGVFEESNDIYEPAYTDPQYIQTGVHKKTELYSFGIILLELLTGSPHITSGPSSLERIIYRVEAIMKSGDINRLVDPRLQGKFNINTASKLAELAMSCASPSADQRPDLVYVLEELECLALEMHSQQTE